MIPSTIRTPMMACTIATLAVGGTLSAPQAASAHHNTINFSVACASDAGFDVTVTVENSERLVETITASSNTAVVPVGATLAEREVKSFTYTVLEPAAQSLALTGRWSNGNTQRNEGTLPVSAFPTDCVPPKPEDRTEDSEWVEGPNDCALDVIELHGVRTSTTWSLEGNHWVATITTTPISDTRPKTAAEIADCAPPPPVDVCPNLDGDQSVVPDGYELADELCALIPVPPVDPPTCVEGEELSNGVCVPADLPDPVPPVTTHPDRLATTGADMSWVPFVAILAAIGGAFLVFGRPRKPRPVDTPIDDHSDIF